MTALVSVIAAILIVLGGLFPPVLAAGHTPADKLFDEANSADISEDYEEAAKKYTAVILMLKGTNSADPLRLRARARLARCCLLQGKFDEAELHYYALMHSDSSIFTKAPELMIDLDDMSDAYLIMAKSPHYQYESLKRCICIRRFINENHPRLPSVYRTLSQYCMSCRNYKEAIAIIEHAIKLEEPLPVPKQMPLIMDEGYLATVYYYSGDMDKSENTCKLCLSQLKKLGGNKVLETQLHASLGRVYTKKGDFDQADKELKTGLKIIAESKTNLEEAKVSINKFIKENEEARARISHGHRR